MRVFYENSVSRWLNGGFWKYLINHSYVAHWFMKLVLNSIENPWRVRTCAAFTMKALRLHIPRPR
jgi:hypothetical protein